MRLRSTLPILIAGLLLVMCTADAAAMYNPRMGRFMQRDPNGQQIAPSLERLGTAGNAVSSSGFIPHDSVRPMMQYRDGMNLYAPYHVMHGGVDPAGLERQVIALEGWGTTIGLSDPWMTKPYWTSVFPSEGVVWNYYDWSEWRAAADYASQAAQKPRPVYSGTRDGPKTPTGECVYDTIIVIGFSNGGDRVFDVVRRLKQSNVKVNLAITVDPVPSGTIRDDKEFLLDLLPGRSGPGYRAVSNATNWLNYYQRSSRFVRGWPVVGAENINLTDLVMHFTLV